MHRSVVRSVTALVGVAVLSVGSAPGWAGAAGADWDRTMLAAADATVSTTAATERTWTEVMAYRAELASQPRLGVITFAAPGPRAALGERLAASATRVGAAPAPQPATALDGRITVQQGTILRSIDPGTGAVTSEPASSASGWVRPSWSPAGDRLHVQRDEGGWVREDLVDEDGQHRTNQRYFDRSDPYEAVAIEARTWSPFGDSVQAASRTGAGAGAWSMNGYRFLSWWYTTFRSAVVTPGRHDPVINSYGDLAVTVWPDKSVEPPVDRLSVASTRFPDGVQPNSQPFNVALSSVRFGVPALGLVPGGDVTKGSADVLAVPSQSADGTVSLLVDHADGRGAQSVAEVGAVCPGPQVAFAPSHTRLVYLKAVGPVGSPCSSTELWELTSANGRYDGGQQRRVAASGSAPFTNLTWKAAAPVAFAGRLAGSDRIGTAVAASRAFHSDRSAPIVVLVNSTAFPDALAATPLAGRLGGPLLMSSATTLDSRTKAELLRVAKPGARVYLVGGEGVLSSAVGKEIADSGFPTKRISGPSRYDTAIAVARELDSTAKVEGLWPASHILVADGTNFPDALVAGPAASQVFGVVVLTNGSALPKVTADYVRAGLNVAEPYEARVVAVGGPAARAVGTDAALRDRVGSLAGVDRYDTARMVLRYYTWPTSIIGVVDGRNWPDAVSGGVAMANAGGALSLVNGTTVPTATRDWMTMTRSSTDTVLAFGGTAVVPDAALRVAQQLAGRQSPVWGLDRP